LHNNLYIDEVFWGRNEARTSAHQAYAKSSRLPSVVFFPHMNYIYYY